MRHCVARKSRKPGVIHSLLKGLIKNHRVKTTLARAKLVRPIFERLVTKGKNDNLTTFRLISSRLRSTDLANTLIKEVCPIVKDRPGGYTRIVKLSRMRRGDGAEEAIISIVQTAN